LHTADRSHSEDTGRSNEEGEGEGEGEGVSDGGSGFSSGGFIDTWLVQKVLRVLGRHGVAYLATAGTASRLRAMRALAMANEVRAVQGWPEKHYRRYLR
jgi:hypothetical protein